MPYKKSADNFNIVLAVWGNKYISFFMDHILPFYITYGNFLAFSRYNLDVQFRIYTLPGYKSAFHAYSSYNDLKKHMDVSIIELESVHKNKFSILSDLLNTAIKDSTLTNSAIIFMMSDIVMPEGSIEKIIKLRMEGYRAIMIWGLPVQKEGFCEKYSSSKNVLSGRDFAQLTLSCLHDEIENQLWNDSSASDSPNSIYWRLPGDNGYLIRAFHLHPIMVEPVNQNIELYYSPDVEYVNRACPDSSTVYVITDSDEMLCASLISANDYRPMRRLTDSPVCDVIAKWSQFGANDLHIKLFSSKIWVHRNDLDDACFLLGSESDDIVQKIVTRRIELDNIFLRIIHSAAGRNIAIFGAGELGLLICRTLPLYNVDPVAIFDNNPDKWGKTCGPVSVCKPSLKMIADCFIVIAAATKYMAISAELESQGFREEDSFMVFNPEELKLLS